MVDYEKAWNLYYELAGRRHNPGLTYFELKKVIDAAFGCGR